MTAFIRPEFTLETLQTYTGYHLQIFASGRAKISLQMVPINKKSEFYALCPKKDRAAYQRQKDRSKITLVDHFATVDQLLSDYLDAKVYRLHEKGNNNATADNAHLLASLEQAAVWLVMNEVVHRWQLTTRLVQVLLEGKGSRSGQASIFNEYAPTQEHDWQDTAFEFEDYRRDLGDYPVRISGTLAPVASSSARWPLLNHEMIQPIQTKTTVASASDEASDYHLDDPYDDPIFYTVAPDRTQDESRSEHTERGSWPTKKDGQSKLYSSQDLRAQLLS